ncbi:hypothetical protein CC78DRAFT_618468 [Lojkania enalia]|uniref:F-box domain-containing protein n=1 Tax=Lojkania enalia TaxID=147567 RepID=A0A9P4K4Q4_9PLEO|nr:hypothetical protein CC78DRAFT_618468 [Didymosphaeria enalia]
MKRTFTLHPTLLSPLSMDRLPKELIWEIFTCLSHKDHLALLQTCRLFTHLIQPLIFHVLSFDGRPQGGWFDHATSTSYHGNRKAVKWAHLDDAIDEVVHLGIAPHVKTFYFSPAFYVKDFWLKYRKWIRDRIDTEIDVPDDNSEPLESDDESGYVEIRKEREKRLEREHKIIEQAEKDWEVKIEEQDARRARVYSATAKLMGSMTSLRKVKIGTWNCDFPESDLDDDLDNTVANQFSRSSLSQLNLELVASGLHSAGHHIKELELPAIDPSLIIASEPMQHIFTELVALVLDLDSRFREATDFLSLDKPIPTPSLFTLIQCARPTLGLIDICFNPDSSLPLESENTLDFLFSTNCNSVGIPLVFPNLKTLKLSMLIVHAPSLIAFLAAQPALRTIFFGGICQGTPGYNFTHVASSLPLSAQNWYVDYCRDEPYPGFQRPVSYNGIKKFKPYESPFPSETGWRIKDPFDENDPDPHSFMNQRGKALLRLEKQKAFSDVFRANLEYAALERIPLAQHP